MIEVEKSAEARATGDLAVSPVVIRRAEVPDQLATEPLMKALPMIVGHQFLDDVPEMSLAEEDEVIQALVPDGFHKPLRMRGAVWASRRNPHALHPSLAKDCFECSGEQRIPVVDQVARISKKAVHRVCL